MLFVSGMALQLYDSLRTYSSRYGYLLALSFSILVYWGVYLIIEAHWSWVKDMLANLSLPLR